MPPTFLHVGTTRDAARVIIDALREQERSIAWLARETGITYKSLLRGLKHRPDSLSLYHAVLIVRVLGLDMSQLLKEVSA